MILTVCNKSILLIYVEIIFPAGLPIFKSDLWMGNGQGK
ncbi:uncharacterized protein EbC_43040 [Erwinia billingiae Eb661]|uniref:Uncharacterized protein n=1 Tax=Erwinia billingiae (strain Eb661) TaxID=634500 RepID=D8ML07_ERWBE|nr:uncharacterized protein EbC_43040 [Erwinia billingiae Eb661]